MSQVWLIPILPLLAAVMVLAGPRESQRSRAQWATFLLMAAFAGSVAALGHVASSGPWSARLYEPTSFAAIAIPLGLLVDRLGAVMMVLISAVGALIFRYSLTYMFEEPDYGRFLALIAVTTSVLLSMVASANLAMLFLNWQLLSYLLYLLAHNLGHEPTREGAVRTFWFLRFGDAAFLAGTALALSLYGTVEFPELFTRAAASPVTLSPLPGISMSGPTAVALLLFLGVMTKSAQFPLHVWLPRSLYAPTPVHALLHAGLINAGGFLMNRLSPLYALSPAALHVALAIGALTAVLGASTMLTQSDIKKTLGFSTIGQMGYMIMECGLGAFALAVFHLVAHGIFKATVFLNCGSVIHQTRREPAQPRRHELPAEPELSWLSWTTGFFTTLLMPLAILLAAHGALHIPLVDDQGAVVFLFFIWITSYQAMLSLARLTDVDSWKVAATMLATLLTVVWTYLFAAGRFTSFLYPDTALVSANYRAAALPSWLFDGCVLLMTVVTLIGWGYLNIRSRGRGLRMHPRVNELLERLYVLLMFNLFLDDFYSRLSRLWPRRARPPARTLSVPVSLALHVALGALPLAALAGVLEIRATRALPAGMVGTMVVGWLLASWTLLDYTPGAPVREEVPS